MKNHRISALNPLLALVSWIGHADLKAAAGEVGAGLGPITQAVSFKAFARIVLLSDAPADQTQQYRDWLQQCTSVGGNLG